MNSKRTVRLRCAGRGGDFPRASSNYWRVKSLEYFITLIKSIEFILYLIIHIYMCRNIFNNGYKQTVNLEMFFSISLFPFLLILVKLILGLFRCCFLSNFAIIYFLFLLLHSQAFLQIDIMLN